MLDLSMPVMTGIEAACALKRLMPMTPIIVFSEYSDVFSEGEARETGAAAVLSKTRIFRCYRRKLVLWWFIRWRLEVKYHYRDLSTTIGIHNLSLHVSFESAEQTAWPGFCLTDLQRSLEFETYILSWALGNNSRPVLICRQCEFLQCALDRIIPVQETNIEADARFPQ
jgi:Response regulator receiver domain